MQNFSTLFYPSSVALVNAKDIASNITVNIVGGAEITDLSAKALDAYDIALVYQSVSSTYLTAVPANLSLTSVNATTILSGGVDLKNIFLTTSTDAQTLIYTPSSYKLSISNGNNVVLSSIVISPDLNATFQSVSAAALSGVFYGDGSNLIGASLPGQAQINTIVQTNSANWGRAYTNLVTNSAAYLSGVDLTFLQEPSANWNSTYTTVCSNSANWQNAYNIATVYQTASSSFATNTLLQSTSASLTPLTLTNTLTAQLVTNTAFNNYQTSVASTTATLLPTSIYQNASGNWQNTFTNVQSNSSNWNGAYNTATVFQANSASYATISFVDSKFLPLSGGTITGNLNVTGQILSGGININQLLSSSGGGGGGVTPIRRFDYVTVANIDYSYSGTAPFGTADTNPIWKLIRLTYANNGTISNQASAINSWTGRLTATYV